MAVHDVVMWPDPVLGKTCDRILPNDPDLAQLCTDLLDTMYAAKGRGLAAPQVGVTKRVCVVDANWKESTPTPMVFINPTVTNASDATDVMSEQCLSIPDLPMTVSRPSRIQLHWETIDGHSVSATFEGVEARCIQHELDHLNGIVIFDHQSPDTQAKLEARYGA